MNIVSQLTVRRLTKIRKERSDTALKKEDRISFQLHHTSRLVKRYMDRDASKSYVEKMTGTHGWAIGYFYNNMDRDIFQKDLEQEFDIRRSTASNILSLMEKNGLIVRQSVPYDARLKKIILTQKALDVQQAVEQAFDKLETRLRSDISDEELACFSRVIKKIQSNIERTDDEND